MQPVRYSINVTLDGCVHHESVSPSQAIHQHAAAWIERSGSLLFGRVTYQMMEEAWRIAPDGTAPDWMDAWMEPFARTIDAAPKHVVSTTLTSVDWHATLLDHTDLERSVRELKAEPGDGIALGGVALATTLAELDLIDEYQFVVHPVVAGHGPRLFDGVSPFELDLVDEMKLDEGAVARTFQRVRIGSEA